MPSMKTILLVPLILFTSTTLATPAPNAYSGPFSPTFDKTSDININSNINTNNNHHPKTYPPHLPKRCLDSTSATHLINTFTSLLTSYNQTTANHLLAPNFTDTSQSINQLTHSPLDAVTFPSKAAFESGQGSQPHIGLTVLGSDFSCENVFFRWEARVGKDSNSTGTGGGAGVKGINWLGAVWSERYGWRVQTVYSEFNSIGWLEAVGGNCTFPGFV